MEDTGAICQDLQCVVKVVSVVFARTAVRIECIQHRKGRRRLRVLCSSRKPASSKQLISREHFLLRAPAERHADFMYPVRMQDDEFSILVPRKPAAVSCPMAELNDKTELP